MTGYQHEPNSIDGLRGRIEAHKAMARHCLQMNSSAGVRQKRYKAQMEKVFELERQLKIIILRKGLLHG